jgi:hypothetical protein
MPVSPPPAMAATGVARVWTGARRMVAVAAGLPGAVLWGWKITKKMLSCETTQKDAEKVFLGC